MQAGSVLHYNSLSQKQYGIKEITPLYHQILVSCKTYYGHNLLLM